MRTHHRGLSGNAVEFEHPYMPASLIALLVQSL